MKESSQQFLQITGSSRAAGAPSLSFGVVSPCSTCKNMLFESKDDKPSCPRRFLQHKAEEARKNGVTEEVVPDYLLVKNNISIFRHLFGIPPSTEYGNPVYVPEQKIVLVWVATFEDNRGFFDPETGEQKVPDLAALPTPNARRSFPTEYMICRPLPCIPSPSSIRNSAMDSFREWDTVMITRFGHSAKHPGTGAPFEAEGYVEKVNPPGGFIIFPPRATRNPPGT